MNSNFKLLFIYLTLIAWLFGCASPMVNMESARINKRFHFSAFSQYRTIEHHSSYRPGAEWGGDPYDRTANAYLIKPSYGFLKNNFGVEFGIKTGTWQHFHWHYQEGSSMDYFPNV